MSKKRKFKIEPGAALTLVEAFHPAADDLAAKSQDLAQHLLLHTPDPFSRGQFAPGHITCTAVILNPAADAILVMHHHRHKRWLLPGGHVEPQDASLAAAARREAIEETGIALPPPTQAFLAGIDVHGIPPRRSEPYHQHHDLIFALHALTEDFAVTEEAPQVAWARFPDFANYNLPPNIVRSAHRAIAVR